MKIAQEIGSSDAKYTLVNWMEEIESNSAYVEALLSIKDLFKKNDEFRFEVQDIQSQSQKSIYSCCMMNTYNK